MKEMVKNCAQGVSNVFCALGDDYKIQEKIVEFNCGKYVNKQNYNVNELSNNF